MIYERLINGAVGKTMSKSMECVLINSSKNKLVKKKTELEAFIGALIRTFNL